MVITVHRWFANKSCPGNWLYARLGDLAARVTANLGGRTSPTEGTLYRVQVGAYKNKANADAQLAHVKAAGFDTYMVQIGGLYKIQVGVYRKKANADNMMAKLKLPVLMPSSQQNPVPLFQRSNPWMKSRVKSSVATGAMALTEEIALLLPDMIMRLYRQK